MTARPRVLIIDDDEIFVALLTEVLAPFYDVVSGRNGHEGLRFCRSSCVDMIVTDIGMPELDGIQMLEEFQKDKALASIPVLVVTATHFSQRNRAEVERFPQVCGIMCKPLNVDAMAGRINKILKERRGAGPPAK